MATPSSALGSSAPVTPVSGLGIGGAPGKMHEFEGYEFKKDSLANQMAFLFDGEEGEKEAARILEEANRRFQNPVQILNKKKFIEEEVGKWAEARDQQLREGCKRDLNFENFATNSETPEGRAANDKVAFNLLKGMGLNVHPDNVTSRYHKGPPSMIMICWVNRPTSNLAKADSAINKLAEGYAASCPTSEKAAFEKNWGAHKAAAHSDSKMDKAAFNAQADKIFAEYLSKKSQGLTQGQGLTSVPDTPRDDEPAPPILH